MGSLPLRQFLKIETFVGLAVAICALVPAPAAALPGDPDEPATGPHEILAHSRPSGTYWFDPDGSDGRKKPFRGSYDSDEGGGWLLVLNYVHRGGTNPELNTRSNKLPLLGGSRLGANESGTANWGHAVPNLLGLFHVEELRFFGTTAHHERVVHFSTDEAGSIAYATTGAGAMMRGNDNPHGINTAHTLLSGHTASIPQDATRGRADYGNLALTDFPFWAGACCTWGVRGTRGEEEIADRWEVDDSLTEDLPSYQYHTIHRVWIRTASVCGNESVEPGEQCDDGNLDPEDGCSALCEIEDGYHCRREPSSCALNTCSDGVVAGQEACDDGNEQNGDGCNQLCDEEHGYSCVDEPSLCFSDCGDGLVARDEGCDDGNLEDRDGCSGACEVEDRAQCGGEPSECVTGCDDAGACVPKEPDGASGCAVTSYSPLSGGCVLALVLAFVVLVRRRNERSAVAISSVVALILVTTTAQPVRAFVGDEREPAAGPHEILEAGRSRGTYWFDPDGTTGPIEPFLGSYDSAEGAGWLLILNYVHQGGTDPELDARSQRPPRLGNGTMGSDESGTEHWGHATPALLTSFQIDEARFFGRTAAHPRVLHFSVQSRYLLDYIQTGEGPTENPVSIGTPLGGHTALLLDNLLVGTANAGDFALTNVLFFGVDPIAGALLAWNVRGTDGLAEGLWSVDDFDFAAPDGHDTIHRVWIRTAALCGNGHVETGEECDDAGTADGDGCSSACEEEFNFFCQDEPSVCFVNACGDGRTAGDDRCDDGNTESGDGCNRECQLEHGFLCTGSPSTCTSTCGDGLVARDEECDDENNENGDGCSAVCVPEADFFCSGEPSLCSSCLSDPDDCADKSDTQASGCSMATSAGRPLWAGLTLALMAAMLVGRRLGSRAF